MRKDVRNDADKDVCTDVRKDDRTEGVDDETIRSGLARGAWRRDYTRHRPGLHAPRATRWDYTRHAPRAGTTRAAELHLLHALSRATQVSI